MRANLTESKPWMDKLRVLQKLASERGSSARIFKAIADPPTTSLQRLKVSFFPSNFGFVHFIVIIGIQPCRNQIFFTAVNIFRYISSYFFPTMKDPGKV